MNYARLNHNIGRPPKKNIITLTRVIKAMKERGVLKADTLPALKQINPTLYEIDMVMTTAWRCASA